MRFKLFSRKTKAYLHPDEIFLDSHNLPSFDNQQFEGRIERPLSKKVFLIFGLITVFSLVGFVGRLWNLQIARGADFAERSENNTLRHRPIFADRGVITDRNGVELAWNDDGNRKYFEQEGFAHVLGYVGYPNEKDLNEKGSDYFAKEHIGRDGVERFYDDVLRGSPGVQVEEIDVRGEVKSNHLLNNPEPGGKVVLAIDSRVQQVVHRAIKEIALERGFSGGAGVIMDVNTGEVLALTSYPEYDPNILIEGADVEKINGYFNDENFPLLDRVVSGLYTPGSIIKPFVALAALSEKVITPEKQILSTGALTLPNPYDPDKPSIFRDWKAHGYTDMRQALAVSSDVYFYEVGGGFEPNNQKGIGVANIEKYTRLFGIAQKTGIDLNGEVEGVIPNPKWKAAIFDGEPWRLGNTYHTSIGQYGFQVTPLQMVRAVGGIATEGLLVTPSITVKDKIEAPTMIDIPSSYFKVVKEGMRMAATEGTSQALSVPFVKVAAKSGTAELGASKARVNSWITGFFPYEEPKYAFAIVMEKGKVSNLVGATAVFRRVLDLLQVEAPEYFE